MNDPVQEYAKTCIPGYAKKRVEELTNLRKNQIRIVTGLLTGHCKLNKHLHKMRLVNSDMCRYCYTHEESAAHIMCDCEELLEYRRKHLGSYITRVTEISQLPLANLLKYVEGIGLMSEL